MVWLTGLRSIWTFYLFAATFGFAYGGVGPMIPAVTGELFGLRHMGSIFGLAILVTSFGGAIGPTVAGYVRDVTGSYSTAFFLGAGAMFAAAVGVFCLKAPKAPASCTYS